MRGPQALPAAAACHIIWREGQRFKHRILRRRAGIGSEGQQRTATQAACEMAAGLVRGVQRLLASAAEVGAVGVGVAVKVAGPGPVGAGGAATKDGGADLGVVEAGDEAAAGANTLAYRPACS